MEDFKLERFKLDFPDVAFPKVEPVPPEECVDLKRRLARKLGLTAEATPLEVLEFLYASFRIEQTGIVASYPAFDLQILLTESGVKAEQLVYINWDQFEHVDQVTLTDLAKYFHYFWYSTSDDIEIFDETLHWAALIRHDGAVRIVRLD